MFLTLLFLVVFFAGVAGWSLYRIYRYERTAELGAVAWEAIESYILIRTRIWKDFEAARVTPAGMLSVIILATEDTIITLHAVRTSKFSCPMTQIGLGTFIEHLSERAIEARRDLKKVAPHCIADEKDLVDEILRTPEVRV